MLIFLLGSLERKGEGGGGRPGGGGPGREGRGCQIVSLLVVFLFIYFFETNVNIGVEAG